MADRQITGGYAKIATVISADLPVTGKLAVDAWGAFKMGQKLQPTTRTSSCASI
jgi:allophanate hydrolase subunit 2